MCCIDKLSVEVNKGAEIHSFAGGSTGVFYSYQVPKNRHHFAQGIFKIPHPGFMGDAIFQQFKNLLIPTTLTEH